MEEVKKEIITAQKYYNDSRKKTFLYSRILVGLSMFILLVGLGTNIFLFNTQERNSIQSQAATETTQNLPDLPENCMYETTNKKTILICASPLPQKDESDMTNVTYPLSIILPQLPPQCQYKTTNSGYTVACDPLQTPIPIVDVPLPPECKPSSDINAMTVDCAKNANEHITTVLPSLPKGCTYTKNNRGFRIVCSAANY